MIPPRKGQTMNLDPAVLSWDLARNGSEPMLTDHVGRLLDLGAVLSTTARCHEAFVLFGRLRHGASGRGEVLFCGLPVFSADTGHASLTLRTTLTQPPLPHPALSRHHKG